MRTYTEIRGAYGGTIIRKFDQDKDDDFDNNYYDDEYVEWLEDKVMALLDIIRIKQNIKNHS